MATDADGTVSEFFRLALAAERSQTDADARLHAFLKDTKTQEGGSLLARYTLHRYQCQRGCQIATVYKVNGVTYCHVKDYKLSHGMNLRESVPRARAKNTLDGERWWPAGVYRLEEFAEFGAEAGFHLTCAHYRGVISAREALSAVTGVKPGRPRKPTTLR